LAVTGCSSKTWRRDLKTTAGHCAVQAPLHTGKL
jgi:hypothetical protein